MSSAQMMRYLKHYGADLHLWPWPLALWARILLMGSPSARQLWHSAQQSERVLQQHLCPQVLPEALQQRLSHIPLAHPRVHSRQSFKPLWWPLGMTLACTCAGIAISLGLWPTSGNLDAIYLANLSLEVMDLILHSEAVL